MSNCASDATNDDAAGETAFAFEAGVTLSQRQQQNAQASITIIYACERGAIGLMCRLRHESHLVHAALSERRLMEAQLGVRRTGAI